MTKPLPFTAAGLARAIKGVELAGRHVVGVKPDGTLIVADRPVDTASLVPTEAHNHPPLTGSPKPRDAREKFRAG
jgi:hypothetical protein